MSVKNDKLNVKIDRMMPEDNLICGFIPDDTESHQNALKHHIVKGKCIEFETWNCNLNLSNITRSRRENYKHVLDKNKLRQTHNLMPVYITSIDNDFRMIEVARKRLTVEEEKQYIANYSDLSHIHKKLSEVFENDESNTIDESNTSNEDIINNDNIEKETKSQEIYKQVHFSENPMEEFSQGFEEYLSGNDDITTYKEFELSPSMNIQLARKMYEHLDFATIYLDFNYILNHPYASDILTKCLEHMTTIEVLNGDKNFKCIFEKKKYKLSVQTKIAKRAKQFLDNCKTQFEQFIKENKTKFKHVDDDNTQLNISIKNHDECKQPTSNLIIIGNVAAGKTTLTQQLTGKSTLTSSEEKKTLRTKELGYASFHICKCDNVECDNICTTHYDCTNFMCDVCENGTLISKNYINIMDCPGHKSFMKHAISGTKNIDYLILVVSATEGCIEQTYNHLLMCEMAGFRNPSRILILLNKSELVLDKLQETIDATKNMLKSTIANKSPIYPISAISGKGLYKVYEWLLSLPNKKRNDDTVIFPIIRSFNSNKCGSTNISGGIIGVSGISGTIKLGDKIYINSGIYNKVKNTCVPIETVVSSIRTETTNLSRASSGGCVAIGTHIDPQLTTHNNMVGMVVSNKELMITNHCKIENVEFIKYSDIYSDKSYTCSPTELLNKNIKIQFLTHLVIADIEKYSKSKNYIKVKFNTPVAITYRKQLVSLYTNTFELIGKGIVIFEGCDMPDEEIDTTQYEPIQYDNNKIVSEFIINSQASEKTRVPIPKPYAHMVTKSKVIINNAHDIVSAVNRTMDLLVQYIKKELNVDANTTSNAIQIYIKMNRNSCEKNIESLIKKFIAKYVQCRQCKSLHTNVETSDTYMCKDCNSTSSIHR
jgi:small GTP-binding protein